MLQTVTHNSSSECNDDAESTVSLVSVRCTNKALNRMIDRDVTREKIRQAKKHGLISLQFVENNIQLAQTWFDRLKTNFPKIKGRILPWTEETGRIKVILDYDGVLTRHVKSFLDENGFFQAKSQIQYSRNDLKVLEGKRNSSSPTQILSVFLVGRTAGTNYELPLSEIELLLREADLQVSFADSINKHMESLANYRLRKHRSAPESKRPVNGIWAIEDSEDNYWIEELSECFHGLDETGEDTHGHNICFIGNVGDELLDIGMGTEKEPGSSTYECSIVRLLKTSPERKEGALAWLGLCTLRKSKTSRDISFQCDFGCNGEESWTVHEKAAVVRGHHDKFKTFGKVEEAFFAQIRRLWDPVVKPAAASLQTPFSGVWSNDSFGSWMATFHFICPSPQECNIGFRLRIEDGKIPEIGLFCLCDFEGRSVQHLRLGAGDWSGAHEKNLFLHLRKFVLRRSEKLMHRMFPVDLRDGRLCLVDPRTSPHTNPCAKDTADVVTELALVAASPDLKGGLVPQPSNLGWWPVPASVLQLLDTQALVPLILLNNHASVRARLEDLRCCGANLARELNLPVVRDDFTPLQWALSQNCCEQVVMALLEAGASPRVMRYGKGWDSVQWALCKSCRERYCLDRDAFEWALCQSCHPATRALLQH
jgi:hypothetical protein